MIKKLVEFISAETQFTIVWNDQKEGNGWRAVILTPILTIPSRESMEEVFKYWTSLKDGNVVLFGEHDVPITFYEAEDSKENV